MHAPVAVAGCRASADAGPTDLYPDGDFDVLRAALTEVGLGVVAVSWDHPDFDWESVAGVVVRSTWDSVDRPEEYRLWAGQVSERTTLINPAELIGWNLAKTYLRDLAGAGVPVVPTRWIRPGDQWRASEDSFVVKPAVSAGGRDTAWYGPGQEAAAEAHVARLLELGQTVMVQPYLPSVAEPGEIDLIFIDGEYSHSVRKGPLLQEGAGVQERPWERMTWRGLADPTDAELAVGHKVVSVVQERFGGCAYGRVDLVDGGIEGPMVLEVELVDPILSLTDCPPAALALAKAVAARVC